MYDLSGELTVILIIICWLQKLQIGWQEVYKQHRSLMYRFNLRKLNELEFRKQYQIKISNRFAALENLNVSEDINRAWENIIENNKTPAKGRLGLYELKQHKPRFNKEFLIFRSKETS
jgi:hypothetical protein